MLRKNIIRTILICGGVVSFVLSYLYFLNILKFPSIPISCANACEYWWSWIVNFPPVGPCIKVCIERNFLYKPFFVIGSILLFSELFYEIIVYTRSRS